jgi:hypothetical protein
VCKIGTKYITNFNFETKMSNLKDSAVEKAKGLKNTASETIDHLSNVTKEKVVEIVHRAEEAVEGTHNT